MERGGGPVSSVRLGFGGVKQLGPVMI